MLTVTLDEIKSWEPCWLETDDGTERLERIGATRERWSALDILALPDVSDEDKLWAVLRKELIPAAILHEFGCRCAERALALAGNPDPRSVAAIEAKRAWLRGEIDDAAVDAAVDAAWAAAGAAAWAAALSAARDAALDAALSAALDAAGAAAWAAALSAARDAALDAALSAALDAAVSAALDAALDAAVDTALDSARDAERAWQVAELRRMLTGEEAQP